jgi:hypothetical protein
MGHHYVPQEYLRGFADTANPKVLWQFDKRNLCFSNEPASIKRIAQQRAFYDEKTEADLNLLVERPGNAVLRKLRTGELALSSNDKLALSVYIATTMNRVPHSRKRGEDMANTVFPKVTDELREKILAAANFGMIDQETAAVHLAETDRVESKLAVQPPPNVVEQIKSPWPREFMINLIFDMTWRFVRATSTQEFITTDNPAFFFQCWGLGREKSEFVFPVSCELAIFGSWTPIRGSDRLNDRKQFVKEANRRLISDATRFVFSRKKQDWIPTVAAKQKPFLSRIQW